MGHPDDIAAHAASSKSADADADVIRVQNADELRLAQMGLFGSFCVSGCFSRWTRPQARVEEAFFGMEFDRVGGELYHFLDGYV